MIAPVSQKTPSSLEGISIMEAANAMAATGMFAARVADRRQVDVRQPAAKVKINNISAKEYATYIGDGMMLTSQPAAEIRNIEVYLPDQCRYMYQASLKGLLVSRLNRRLKVQKSSVCGKEKRVP